MNRKQKKGHLKAVKAIRKAQRQKNVDAHRRVEAHRRRTAQLQQAGLGPRDAPDSTELDSMW